MSGDETPNIAWWEWTKTLGSKPGLEPIKATLRHLGEPQDGFKSVHVTGTNGKGSTAAMTASILLESGYSVGLFTSPHLSSWTESIVVDGDEITRGEMEEVLGRVREAVDSLTGARHPTHFEVLTAAAFTYFKDRGVEYAVVEVGMGGVDDATNVIPSSVSVLTNVSLEHTEWLGDTVEEIARAKAGILREGTALVTAVGQPEVIEVINNVASEMNSDVIRVGVNYIPVPVRLDLGSQRFHLATPNGEIRDLEVPLLGVHQLLNASCAVAAAQRLRDPKVTEETIREGLRKAKWPGRFEIVARKPLIVLDGAKDARATERLRDTVTTILPGVDVFTVFGASSDKDIEAMTRSLADVTGRFFITEHRVKARTATVERIEEAVEKTCVPYEVAVPVRKAVEKALELALEGDAVLVTGSVFLVGEAREIWRSHSSNSG